MENTFNSSQENEQYNKESEKLSDIVTDDESHHFFAMMHRMRYINRWGLMRNTEKENIQEHSMQVALIAHALAVFRKKFFADNSISPEPEKVALLGMFHDASEILTGDLPTPVKYFNPQIKKAYKTVEEVASEKLLTMLPVDLQEVYRELLMPKANSAEMEASLKFVKAADKLSAYIKCLDEEKAGNPEFLQAKISLEQALNRFKLPEVEYFLQVFLPSYSLTLDQLSEIDANN